MTSSEIQSGTTILWPPNRLIPDPDQPRQEKNWDLEGTSKNILDLRARGLGIEGTGVLQSLSVRLPPGALDANGVLKPNTSLFIVDGEGRWRSAGLANEERPGAIPFVPITLQDVSAEDAFEIAYFANAFSKPMSDLDHARALLRIKKRHNIGYEQLARRTNHTKEYIRTRLKAVSEEDTIPILEARPDSIYLVRRINQVEPGEFRTQLIEMALNGATNSDVDDSIAARRAGLSIERYRAEKNVRKFERAHEQESKDAKSSVPTNDKSPPKARSSSSTAPTSSEANNSADGAGNGLEVRPYVGDVLDVLTRQLEDAKNGLLEVRLSPDRRTDLLSKARNIRALTDELISGLEAGQK